MGGLQEQLAPFYHQLRGGTATSHPVLALLAQLPDGSDETIATARREALKWMSKSDRVGKLPERAWQFESFEVLHGGKSGFAARVRSEADGIDYWAARCELFLQGRFDDRARTFTTEISVAAAAGRGLVGLRLQVAEHAPQLTIKPTVPGILRQWMDRPGLSIDDQQLALTARRALDEATTAELIEYIDSASRQLPVVVVSSAGDDSGSEQTVVNGDELAERLLGLAAVYVVGDRQTYALSNWWGQRYSCFDRAVRIYWPGFDYPSQSPYEHPLYLVHQIENWTANNGEDFVDALVRIVGSNSVRRLWRDDRLPSYNRVKHSALQAEQRAIKSDRPTPSQPEIENLEQQLRVRDEEVDLIHAEAARLENEIEELRQSITNAQSQEYYLNQRISQLEALLEQANHQEEVPIPASYSEMADWVGRYLAGKLVLLPRAAGEAKNAGFENVGPCLSG